MITEAGSGNALNGAKVQIVNQLPFANSDATGAYATGFAIPGSYDVLVTKPGYLPAEGTVDLASGEVAIFNAELEALPSFAISGTVTEAATGDPIPDAQVKIFNEDF